jgi:Ser/Thr protein kinase RdoA (MazF antagonist)
MNQYNFIVGENGELAMIDFNDMVRSYRVFEIGHCIAYLVEAQQCDLMVSMQPEVVNRVLREDAFVLML